MPGLRLAVGGETVDQMACGDDSLSRMLTYVAGSADPMTEPVPPELLDAVVAYFHPLRVILFGSAARGDTNPNSDIDLIVLVDDETPPEQLTLAAGYQSRQSYHRAADVIPCRESVFRRKSRVPGTLAHAVATEGRVVYERR